MKKLIAYALALVLILALVGCNNTPSDQNATTPTQTTPQQTPTDGTTPTETTPEVTTPEVTTPEVTTPEVTTPEVTTPEVTTPEPEQPENPTKEVSQIVDLAKTQNIPTDDALECFYTDANFHYFFDSIKSSYVTVYYKDGTEENVIDALGAGHITVTDLEKYDIGYSKRVRGDLPKLTITALRELIAAHGENLTWEHFDGYAFIETGSGLYIRIYPINGEYELWIGGGDPSSEPMYIYFMEADVQDGEETKPIDVRYESIDDLLNPTGLAQILVDYEITLKDELDALCEKNPHRIYYFHPVDRVSCVYFLQGNTTADAIVQKHNMENVFSNAKVSAYNKTKTIIISFDRDDFTEATHQKLEKIKDDESAITSLWVDMIRSVDKHFMPKIDYYTDHAVPLEHVATIGSHWHYEGEDMIFKTKAEYDAYLDALSQYANYDYEVGKIAEWREQYNEAFFEENALILTRVFSGSSSIGVRIDNLYISDNTVYVVKETKIPVYTTEDVVIRYFTIQVPKSEVADVDKVITVS